MQKNVIEYLYRTAEKYPEKIAVSDPSESISFSSLLKASEKLAGVISSKITSSSPVGVFVPKSCKMVECFAGISRSGNFYIPLDTKSPVSRIQTILDVLEAGLVITDRERLELLASFYHGSVIVIEDVLEDCNCPTNIDIKDRQIDTDPVYAIFTSGSTGTPKGVVVTHRGVIDYIDWAVETFHVDERARIGNQAPFYFDNSTLDIYLMYATGATLIIIPESYFAFPAKLVDFMNQQQISFVFWVPFVLINVANLKIFETKKPLYLKDVLFAGEVMPNKHLNYWRKHLPECHYANLYGPTEITVDCTYYPVEREFLDDEPLPIGFPCRNSDVLILVDRKREAKLGEQGELCVRGSSLALGYYNNPEKTASAFIQNPLNNHYPETIYCTGDLVYKNEQGEIIFVGRIDSQIKHNGYRIELGEIENAVNGSQMVDNCCVVYDHSNKKIVLFYQPSEGFELPAFRKALLKMIPRYMVPSDFRCESEMALNANGKIDRKYYNQIVNG